MNYLSHYFFDRRSSVPEEVLGGALPDLLRSFNSRWVLNTETMSLTDGSPGAWALLNGWQRHKAIDRVFHSSASFARETASLKLEIKPILINSPIWSYFLAHIFYELNLDAVLLKDHVVDAGRFYQDLEIASRQDLLFFLEQAGAHDAKSFLPWLDRFIQSRYLFSYDQGSGIAYALDRICSRLWKQPLTQRQNEALSGLCETYQQQLLTLYPELLAEIGRGIDQ